MILNLAEVQFENDFFTIDLPDGNILTLNVIDESILVSTNEVININRINIQITEYSGDVVTYVNTPNVIGFNNGKIKINTLYEEYKGKVLTKDNMMYCTVEYYEQ